MELDDSMITCDGIKKVDVKRFTKGTAVTIGVFDGVHLGHTDIIKKTVACARENNLKSLVVTFDPHPMKLINAKTPPAFIISLKHRLDLIASMGVDFCVLLHFSKKFSKTPAEKFFKQIIVEKLNAKHIFVGENFLFGADRLGNTKELERLCKVFGVKMHLVKKIRKKSISISSTVIRNLVEHGKLKLAEKILGRPVLVLGSVVKGARFARVLGYPTANINPHHEVIPPSGVYAVKILLGGNMYYGALNIGRKPTFPNLSKKDPSIEVHIFDFKKQIYGKDVYIEFVKKIRDEKRFDSADKLVAEIKKDEKKIRRLFKIE